MFFLCPWVRASWINVNICPKRCEYIQFYYIFCRQIYMFRMIPSSIIRSTFKGVPTPPRQRMVANRVRPVPDAVITVWVCSWWWMRVSSETCRAVYRKYNKTVYSRILLDNYWHREPQVRFLFDSHWLWIRLLELWNSACAVILIRSHKAIKPVKGSVPLYWRGVCLFRLSAP